MSLLTVLWSIVIAASFILAIQHLMIWFKLRSSTSNLLFSISAISASFVAIFEFLQLQTTSIETYQLVVKLGHIPVFLLLVSLVWFVDIYFGTGKRWLTILISVMWTLALIINFASETNLAFESISELKRVTLPWGEEFSLPVGTANSWKYITDVASFLILIFIIDATIRLWKSGETQRALIVGGSMVFFILLAGIHTPLVDAGLIKSPYLVSFAFLGIIFAMSSE